MPQWTVGVAKAKQQQVAIKKKKSNCFATSNENIIENKQQESHPYDRHCLNTPCKKSKKGSRRGTRGAKEVRGWRVRASVSEWREKWKVERHIQFPVGKKKRYSSTILLLTSLTRPEALNPAQSLFFVCFCPYWGRNEKLLSAEGIPESEKILCKRGSLLSTTV